MASVLLFGAIVVFWAPAVVAQVAPTSHIGTTPNIEDVFVGRCWDYDVTRYRGLLPRVNASCDNLWNNFETGFRYKKPCDVTTSGYDNFYNASVQQLPQDKVMFWSGVYALAHRLSDAARKYITLEDTMMGYLVNSLIWCGKVSDPGIDFDRCPEWNDCHEEASESFWAGASIMYAKMASGEVTLMLGGSNPNRTAYRRGSFFGKYELPSMANDRVTKVIVLVTHILGQPKIETCNNGSLVELEKDVVAKGFVYECVDDPESVIYLLCADDPDAEECQLANAHASGQLSYPVHDTKTDGMNSMPLDRFNN